MPLTSREIVSRCLKFEYPERMPRDLWTLPWCEEHFPEAMKEIRRRFPSDFQGAPNVYLPSSCRQGEPHAVGTFIDEWGCAFTNIQRGVIGEVKTPMIRNLSDWRNAQPPYETLPGDVASARDTVNRACAETPKFVLAGCCPRPWERYQFLRGSANAMMDLLEGADEARQLLRRIHDFHLQELEFWVSTDVDGIMFMDDWGSQKALLIDPALWRELFKPLYRDYCALAHERGKFAFMHSDGHIAAVYEDLIEVGVDAVNSQLFCMDMDALARVAKGRITFWGEIDRQHILPSKDSQAGRNAVRKVAARLYDPSGGVIAQFELGAGANPATAIAIFEEWECVEREYKTLCPLPPSS
ncbi:MAG: methyltransferase [Candidatus Sumerlaeota bacterium]|nr:methyltransferase [Candidatus Sumerlaeota bacterium]